MRALIVHGSFGDPEENWIPWVRERLEERGWEVVVPRFPTPERQDLESWTEVISDVPIDSSTVLIGHSTGAAFVLSILERIPASACYLISGFIGPLGNDTFDPLNRTFAERRFDWDAIRSNCERFLLFHGDDDPYVPLEKACELRDLTGGELIVIPHGGHLNSEAGFASFPQLLREL